MPEVFMKWSPSGTCWQHSIKYFLLYSFALGFFLLNINHQHLEPGLEPEKLLSVWDQVVHGICIALDLGSRCWCC